MYLRRDEGGAGRSIYFWRDEDDAGRNIMKERRRWCQLAYLLWRDEENIPKRPSQELRLKKLTNQH